MPLFDELMDRKKLEDPEERKAEELQRSSEVISKKSKATSTSVTANQYNWTMRIVVFALGLIGLSVAAFLVYLGVMSFIPAG